MSIVGRSVLATTVIGTLAVASACTSSHSAPAGAAEGGRGGSTQFAEAGSPPGSGHSAGGAYPSASVHSTGGAYPSNATLQPSSSIPLATAGQGGNGTGTSSASESSVNGGSSALRTQSANGAAGSGGSSVLATTRGAGGTSATAGAVTSAASGGTRAATSAVTSAASGGTHAATSATTSTTTGCLASTFLTSLGKSSLMIGASMQDDTANAAPFDARYLYLSGGFQDQADLCASCATDCSTTDKDAVVHDCSNAAGGCAWWGCWQWDQDPPGKYVLDFVTKTAAAQYAGKAHPQIPVITYYQSLQGSRVTEGGDQIRALNDRAFLYKYFEDFRLVVQKIGTASALLHIEPDLWGYASQQIGNDPHAMPAAVTSANSADCSNHENSVAGFARCLISMTRKYAPNTKVGLHASAWGTAVDVLLNKDAAFDVSAEAAKLGSFLVKLGAAEGDFIVADMSDRDAGYYAAQGRNVWWDASNGSLPNFHQALAWGKALTVSVGKPLIWWQIPLGNATLENTTNHYKDNRVDYLFSHLDEVVDGNAVALLFGAGEGQQTLPETDGGNLIAKVIAAASSKVRACP